MASIHRALQGLCDLYTQGFTRPVWPLYTGLYKGCVASIHRVLQGLCGLYTQGFTRPVWPLYTRLYKGYTDSMQGLQELCGLNMPLKGRSVWA